jgi:hypothetical protein
MDPPDQVTGMVTREKIEERWHETPSNPPSLPGGGSLSAVASRIITQRPALASSLVVHGRTGKRTAATFAGIVRETIHGLLPAAETGFATAGMGTSIRLFAAPELSRQGFGVW